MVDYSELFIDETDRMALAALKAIPGFDLLVKKFLEIYDENILRIDNLSSRLRINENQMPKYHNMLVDVCNKLHIEKPDFYLELNPNMNAYTVGETKPTIVISSGLIETFPDELIPTVLAHECGHIVCHHTFYTTLATYLVDGILTGVSKYFDISAIAIDAINAAFMYWSRCSEISADRLAIVYDGTPNKMIECCMRFCGYDKDIKDTFSVEEFLSQAHEYKQLTKDSKWKKILEIKQNIFNSHPLNSIRALKCEEWSKRDDFEKILDLYRKEKLTDIPFMYDSDNYENDNYEEVSELFNDMGFDDVKVTRKTDSKKKYKDGKVMAIKVNGEEFKKYAWAKNTDLVEIEYFQSKTDEEIAAEHPGESKILNSLNKYFGKNFNDVQNELLCAGFKNVVLEPNYLHKKSIFIKDDSVIKVTFENIDKVQKGDWINNNTKITIQYNKYEL